MIILDKNNIITLANEDMALNQDIKKLFSNKSIFCANINNRSLEYIRNEFLKHNGHCDVDITESILDCDLNEKYHIKIPVFVISEKSRTYTAFSEESGRLESRTIPNFMLPPQPGQSLEEWDLEC